MEKEPRDSFFILGQKIFLVAKKIRFICLLFYFFYSFYTYLFLFLSHPAIWSFQALFESNAQLNVLAECPHYNKNNFCLPPEGIALKGKCLLLLGEGNE